MDTKGVISTSLKRKDHSVIGKVLATWLEWRPAHCPLTDKSNNKPKIFQPTLSWRRTTRASSATVRRVRRRVKRTSRHLRIEILSDVCSPVSISRIKGIRNLETVTRRWSTGVCSNILVYLNLHQTSIGKIMSWTCWWWELRNNQGRQGWRRGGRCQGWGSWTSNVER